MEEREKAEEREMEREREREGEGRVYIVFFRDKKSPSFHGNLILDVDVREIKFLSCEMRAKDGKDGKDEMNNNK